MCFETFVFIKFRLQNFSAADPLCESKSADAAFFNPWNDKEAIIIKFPNFYLFDLVQGAIMNTGLVKEVWPLITKPPIAAFTVSGLRLNKTHAYDSWFPNSSDIHPTDEEAYVIFLTVSISEPIQKGLQQEK